MQNLLNIEKQYQEQNIEQEIVDIQDLVEEGDLDDLSEGSLKMESSEDEAPIEKEKSEKE